MHQGEDDLRPTSSRLRVAGDPEPVGAQNEAGGSNLVLIGDHAGRAIPARLGDLGLCAADLDRHIAWDIGVAGLGAALSRKLDAVFIQQRFSRLVIDCNRAPGVGGSIAAVSDGSVVPGNQTLGPQDRRARVEEVFQPYQDRIAQVLDDRQARRQPTILVSLHSFTPSLGGAPRPWRFGVLHRGDSAFSRAVLAVLRADWAEEAGDNQPYAMDGIDYTIPFHADARGLDYLELEVRQDLIATAEGQAEMAGVVASVLSRALAL